MDYSNHTFESDLFKKQMREVFTFWRNCIADDFVNLKQYQNISWNQFKEKIGIHYSSNSNPNWRIVNKEKWLWFLLNK